jgi:NNP family nitrate/nitrite transporter-like MFS transporter
MQSHATASRADQNRALGLSTIAFTACFAVWTIFSIIGVAIKGELGLNDTQFGLLVATPILTGSLTRVFLGVWTEKYGGRLVFSAQMILAALATWALTFADTYIMYLVAALGVGLAGGSFIIGVAYVSRWYDAGHQGTALGIFGAGNVGAAVTKFVAPFVMVAYGWQGVANVWAAALALMGVIFFVFAKDDPALVERRRTGAKAPGFAQQFAPLKNLQVWRFSMYYFFVFGAFVALALWLPHYLIDVYAVDVRTAGMAAASFSLSASLFRAYGGHLSDKFGARSIMYWTFGFSMLFLFMLSYPPTDYVIQGKDGVIAFSTSMGLWPFVATLFALGFFMSLGKAAVFKHIPVYYPNNVGAVGGLVGMIGGLGGFVLPIAFGALLDLTGIYTSCFALLFVLVAIALTWMHLSIRAMERAAHGDALDRLPELPELPEMQSIHSPERTTMPRVLADWHPEDAAFWAEKGRVVARRNLWISIPALLLAFSVWMVWSMVVAKLPLIGFAFTPEQLFWLAALPALSGATLRIFYGFMVPIFGGRLWTTLSTASLMLPAIGIGYAVQNPETPYFIFLVLALLCGLGGANFASSMANIGYFFPKAEKGNALALNAGLGNLGVSVMQFLVPLVITVGVFGTMGGAPQTVAETGASLWMQNAGFIWVPFILISTVAAWLGMNDIADAKASFAQQSVIFGRTHNWLMCVLYIGTFGSFIGYSAGFPLLSRIAFPDINALQYVFLGPLVGALSRAGTGWVSDKFGGGRVTFWVFVGMIVSVLAVILSLQAGTFAGFFAGFMALFFFTGVGNASTFQMIPVIMGREVPRLMPQLTGVDRARQIAMESGGIVAFTSAIGAYGGFFIPKAYGSSIAMTGSPIGALWLFLIFYVLCLAITWAVYARPGGLLHDIERGRVTPAAAHPAE